MSSLPKFSVNQALAAASIVPWTFELGRVQGLSTHALEVHLGLYATYVKEANLLLEQLQEFPRAAELSAVERLQRDGLVRRLAFEHNGVRLHEAFFEALAAPGMKPAPSGVFIAAAKTSFGSLERWQADVADLAKTRGVGWVVTFRCSVENRLTNVWVDDHTRGLLMDLSPVAVFDLWEHAYMLDFKPSQRAEYLQVLFNNLNWQVIEQRCAA